MARTKKVAEEATVEEVKTVETVDAKEVAEKAPAKKATAKKTTAKKTTAKKAEATPEVKEEAKSDEVVTEKPKKTRKKATTEVNDSDIVYIGGEKTVRTEEDELRESILDLIESKKIGKILTDTITGIEQHGSKKVAVLFHGDLKVIIPAELLIPTSSMSKEDERYQYALDHSTIKHLGAEVDYVIEEFDQEGKVAIANRLKAMKTKQRQYYLGFDRNGNKILYPGAYCEARIVSVTRSGVFVEVFGIETFVPLRELSYQRIINPANEFTTGMTVLVKILELDTSDKDNIKVAVSIKQGKENPAQKALEKISIDNYYMGTVTMVDVYGVFVSLDCGVDCLCKHPINERPVRGAKASVRIMGINKETNRVWGLITHISNVM